MSSLPPEIPINRVEAHELRRLFNDVERILERVASHELIVVELEINYAITSPEEPPGTVGKMLSYRDPANNDFEHARAYAYIRPDRTFGGSGRRLPDPKIVYHNGEYYLQLRTRQPSV